MTEIVELNEKHLQDAAAMVVNAAQPTSTAAGKPLLLEDRQQSNCRMELVGERGV